MNVVRCRRPGPPRHGLDDRPTPEVGVERSWSPTAPGALHCPGTPARPLLKKIGLTDLALQRTAVAAAQKLVQQAQKTSFAQASRECIERVILAENEIAIHLSREGLLKLLLGPDARGVPKRSTGRSELVLACPFERRHWSNELRLVVPSADGAQRAEPTPLLRAIARARQWYKRIAAGEIYCLQQLAKEQDQLRHHNVRITLELYAKSVREDQKAAHERVVAQVMPPALMAMGQA